jgi:hypothetical protein
MTVGRLAQPKPSEQAWDRVFVGALPELDGASPTGGQAPSPLQHMIDSIMSAASEAARGSN